jgi:SpoU rRNA methylase family enzyme
MAQPTEQSDQQAHEIGRRQSLFREVNERIDELAGDFDLQDEMKILCECASDQCTERIAMTEEEYENLRRIPTHFAVLAGHEITAVERVVEKNDRYIVVEKLGESAAAAIKLDPRRRA